MAHLLSHPATPAPQDSARAPRPSGSSHLRTAPGRSRSSTGSAATTGAASACLPTVYFCQIPSCAARGQGTPGGTGWRAGIPSREGQAGLGVYVSIYIYTYIHTCTHVHKKQSKYPIHFTKDGPNSTLIATQFQLLWHNMLYNLPHNPRLKKSHYLRSLKNLTFSSISCPDEALPLGLFLSHFPVKSSGKTISQMQ